MNNPLVCPDFEDARIKRLRKIYQKFTDLSTLLCRSKTFQWHLHPSPNTLFYQNLPVKGAVVGSNDDDSRVIIILFLGLRVARI